MSNIEVYKPEQNLYLVAFQSEKASEMPKLTLVSKLAEIIQITYQRKGQAIGEKDLGFQASDLTVSISNDFKFIRIDEIREAFKKGVFGEYGEYFGLNSATYHRWIKSYLESQERAELMMKLNTPKMVEEQEPPREEVLTRIKSATKRLFCEYKKKGKCEDIFNCVYDFLDRNGLVSLSKEEKWKFFHEAKEKLLEEKKLQLSTSASMKRNEIKKVIELLESKDEKDKEKAGTMITSRAKNISINYIFSKIANVEELEILLDSVEI